MRVGWPRFPTLPSSSLLAFSSWNELAKVLEAECQDSSDLLTLLGDYQIVDEDVDKLCSLQDFGDVCGWFKIVGNLRGFAFMEGPHLDTKKRADKVCTRFQRAHALVASWQISCHCPKQIAFGGEWFSQIPTWIPLRPFPETTETVPSVGVCFLCPFSFVIVIT